MEVMKLDRFLGSDLEEAGCQIGWSGLSQSSVFTTAGTVLLRVGKCPCPIISVSHSHTVAK